MAGIETSGSGDIARTMALLWQTGPRPSRGPKPALSLDRIVEAAIRIADADGLDAVTMRRVATELGIGTMSLYRYLPGKGELLDLMLDRVQRPATDPADDTGWRAALESLAHETLALYRRHPWLLQVNQTRPVLGPSAVAALDTTLGRIRPMGLSDPELVSVVVMIDGYVAGAARTHRYEQEAQRSTGLTDTEFWQAQAPILEQVINFGRFPVMATLSESAFAPDFDHFTFGLTRILDGLEVLVTRRAAEQA